MKLSAGKASAKAPSKVCSITTIFLPKQKEEEKVKIERDWVEHCRIFGESRDKII